MRHPTARAALALVTLLFAGAARAAEPVPAPPVPAPGSDAPAAPARPSEADVRASLNAIGAADTRRLLTDRAYAGEILGHLDRIAPYMSDDAAAVTAVRNLRLLALATLGRRADAAVIIDEVIEARPAEAAQYTAPWLAALQFEDWARAVALVETASRAVPGVRWADVRSLLSRETVWGLLVELKNARQNADRVRFAEALFRIGWPGAGDTQSGDYIRSILLDDRLAAGDAAAARGYADGISTLGNTVPLLLGKRYDIALPAGADRLALLRAAIARQDQATREALAAAPGDMQRLYERANYLRSLAREEEALALLRPHLADVRATAANGEHGVWVLMEGASALAALGRQDEALTLMDRVAELPMEANPSLISLRINHLGMLWEAGRFDEVLRRATALDGEAERFASNVGRSWIATARVCALASLNRGAEAAPLIVRLRDWSETNPAALSNAYLCLGDEAAVAALMVHRLESTDPDRAIQALQDYTLGGDARGPVAAIQQRTAAVRARPEVQAALDRVGRRLALPLARRFWVEY
jgi:tetratricopeptide (TPR) repeat protein